MKVVREVLTERKGLKPIENEVFRKGHLGENAGMEGQTLTGQAGVPVGQNGKAEAEGAASLTQTGTGNQMQLDLPVVDPEMGPIVELEGSGREAATTDPADEALYGTDDSSRPEAGFSEPRRAGLLTVQVARAVPVGTEQRDEFHRSSLRDQSP